MTLEEAAKNDSNRATALLLIEHALDVLKLMTADSLVPQDYIFDMLIEACTVCCT